jgi:hypothetical protein
MPSVLPVPKKVPCIDLAAVLVSEHICRLPAEIVLPLSCQVSLFRADALSSVIELDKHLAISSVDEAAGLIFGVNSKQLIKKAFARCGVGYLHFSLCTLLA